MFLVRGKSSDNDVLTALLWAPQAPCRSALDAVQEVRPAAWHAALVGVLVVARVLGLRVVRSGRRDLAVGPSGGVHPLGHGVREGRAGSVVRRP